MANTDKTLNETEVVHKHTQQAMIMDIDVLHMVEAKALAISPQDQCKSIQYACALILSKCICNQLYIKETRNDNRDFPIKIPKLINWNSLLDLAVVADYEICQCINILMSYINIMNKGTKLYLPEDYTDIPNGVETIPVFIVEFEKATGPIPCSAKWIQCIYKYLNEEFQKKANTTNIKPLYDPAGFISLMSMRESIENIGNTIRKINQYMGTTK